MKLTRIVSVSIFISGLAIQSGTARPYLSGNPAERAEIMAPTKELNSRFLAADPDLTVEEFAVLYYDFLRTEWIADYAGTDRENFINNICSDGRFAEVTALISRNGNDYFREELGMTILHLLYGSNKGLDGATYFIDRLNRLLVIQKEEAESVAAEELELLVNEVMEYYMELVLMSEDIGLEYISTGLPDIDDQDN